MRSDCSWRAVTGRRIFGKFERWDGDYAVVRKGACKVRIHKSQLTFEAQ